jgi:hypothetical protein
LGLYVRFDESRVLSADQCQAQPMNNFLALCGALWKIGNYFCTLPKSYGFSVSSVPLLDFVWSSDSQHSAYTGAVGLAVVDGKEYQYDGALFPVFSPDSQHFAFTAHDKNGFMEVVDGQESKTYDTIDSVSFSPDGEHMAFVAEVNKQVLVVVDGQEGKPYGGIDSLSFSRDSKHLAFVAEVNKQAVVVVDGQESKPYDSILGSSLNLLQPLIPSDLEPA